MTENSIIIAGFGGQGILLAGETLANALMMDDKNVTWYPCYGAEMRGGTVNCEIVTSDDEVSSVNKQETDFVIALNQQSFDRFLPKLKKGGSIIVNSSLAKEEAISERKRDDVNYFFAPITKLANDDLGDVRTTNMISLGILAKVSSLTTIELLHKGLENILPEHRKNLLLLNLKAFEMGFNLKLNQNLVSC